MERGEEIVDQKEQLKFEIRVKFENNRHAEIAANTLSVDKEPRKELIQKHIRVEDNFLIVNWSAKLTKLLRVSVNSFLDHLILVIDTIEQFHDD